MKVSEERIGDTRMKEVSGMPDKFGERGKALRLSH